MPQSLFSPEAQAIVDQAKRLAGQPAGPFPSPADWRDQWIYFLMVDRFNNPLAPPKHPPFDDPKCFQFQGGNFAGIQAQLDYLVQLGAGAIWISPVLKNVPFQEGTYHGYGIHDFMQADARFATDPAHADDELRALVDAAHQRGLYVVLDIVLNHTGDVFAYTCDPGETTCLNNQGAAADFRPNARPVMWRDATGAAQAAWTDIGTVPTPSPDEIVWPSELQQNDYYRRQGKPGPDDTTGDFESLKQFRTDLTEVQQALIRAYQYVIARFDVDAFRIDTLRYLKGGFPLLFGNSIREFALSIGKKNFFTFGEVDVGDAEVQIAKFIGRTTTDSADSDMVGVDAALDYPLYFSLKSVVKGFSAPSDLVAMYQFRKQTEADVLSSHGDATRYFVTFVDNHDNKERVRYVDPDNPNAYDDQVTLAVACLYSLPGVPCLYYGTEQGLSGRGTDDPAVREAVWGGPGFPADSFYYQHITRIAQVRSQTPALRYGRFYFRPISGDGAHFGISTFPQGVLAFSRILFDQEIVIAANTSTSQSSAIDIIVDATLSPAATQYRVLYSNKTAFQAPAPVAQKAAGTVTVAEVDGSTGTGPLNSIHVTLQPLEVQILGR